MFELRELIMVTIADFFRYTYVLLHFVLCLQDVHKIISFGSDGVLGPVSPREKH